MTKAFNDDEVLLQIVKDLVDKHKVDLICETGTHTGNTTVELAKIVRQVDTIELNHEYRRTAVRLAEENNIKNIFFHAGNSPEKINHLELWEEEKTVLFFLDAHWNAYNPLLDELKAIAGLGIKPVILIHDFFVPGKSTKPGAMWGYDTYGGQDYTWEWVKESIEKIYGDAYKAWYNDHYVANRGCLIVEPV